jgi:hypothetical protein
VPACQRQMWKKFNEFNEKYGNPFDTFAGLHDKN